MLGYPAWAYLVRVPAIQLFVWLMLGSVLGKSALLRQVSGLLRAGYTYRTYRLRMRVVDATSMQMEYACLQSSVSSS